MSDDIDDEPESVEDNPREQRGRFERLSEQLTGLLDPESALRRGQGLVTGVTQATKDELVRIVSAETRNFLDGMDIADLLQQVIAGLTIDIDMQVRFSREDDGPAQPEITRQKVQIRRGSRSRGSDEPEEDDSGSETSKKRD